MRTAAAAIEVTTETRSAVMARLAVEAAEAIPPGTVLWRDWDGRLQARHAVPPSLLRHLEEAR